MENLPVDESSDFLWWNFGQIDKRYTDNSQILNENNKWETGHRYPIEFFNFVSIIFHICVSW